MGAAFEASFSVAFAFPIFLTSLVSSPVFVAQEYACGPSWEYAGSTWADISLIMQSTQSNYWLH